MASKLASDPRIDPRIRALMGQMEPSLLPNVESREALLAIARGTLGKVSSVAEVDPAPFEAFAPSTGLSIRRQDVASQPDGNTIALQIILPDDAPRPLPCVYYMHGGGMMMGSCFEPGFSAWGRLLAAQGVAVVQVDFRNCLFPSSAPEVATFPAGLNDCVSGLRWVHAHASELGIDSGRIVLCGESGGGNLSLATALKLNRDGDIGLISGIYAMCPYLDGIWAGGPGTSADENAGIMMDARSNFGAMAYGIAEVAARNPLAWPAFASEDDVRGFPPVVINVNECDPLRDDGVNFYRLLLRAGVPARAKILLGTTHGTEVFSVAWPDIGRAAAREVADLARGS